MIVNNQKELDSYIEKQVVKFLNGYKETILDLFVEYIHSEFYDLYEPSMYERTYQILASLVADEVVKKGGEYYVDIYVDTSVAKYPKNEFRKKSVNPIEIFSDIAEGWHGTYTQTEGMFYESLIDELTNGNNNLLNKFKDFLKKKGFKII